MPYEVLPGTRAPVKVWTEPWTIEPQAQQQLRNIGNLPWVEGVAVMPDVHYGKGATVGPVIAMRQALAPAAVGVDIGCVDADTEYLSPDGWRRVSDYDGDRSCSMTRRLRGVAGDPAGGRPNGGGDSHHPRHRGDDAAGAG